MIKWLLWGKLNCDCLRILSVVLRLREELTMMFV